MPTVSVDKDMCIGCSACVNTCPSGFKMVDNKSVPTDPKPKKITCQNEAADVCPVNCITVK